MAFNFGGMMRGLGAGMVGYGEILRKIEKRELGSLSKQGLGNLELRTLLNCR